MKTPLAALVAIPPDDVCAPIDAIRKIHDRHVREWMPHVTLLFPFWPRGQFEEAAKKLADLAIAPFETRLAVFKYFRHTFKSHTIWLDPEPAEPWKALQAELQKRFPECDEVSRHPGGFAPHLSVGGAPAPVLARILQRPWKPVSYTVSDIALIWREEGKPFQVDRRISLSR